MQRLERNQRLTAWFRLAAARIVASFRYHRELVPTYGRQPTPMPGHAPSALDSQAALAHTTFRGGPPRAVRGSRLSLPPQTVARAHTADPAAPPRSISAVPTPRSLTGSIERHVGLGDPQLRRNLKESPNQRYQSTFGSEPAANRAIGLATKQTSKIESWLAAPRSDDMVALNVCKVDNWVRLRAWPKFERANAEGTYRAQQRLYVRTSVLRIICVSGEIVL